MSYGLRYYKELTHSDGTIVRLEFYQEGRNEEPVEFGAIIQGLSLEIQGQQGDIDVPIVKTSLSMSFADCEDVDDGRKNGGWEEFYTAHPTGWMVEVSVATTDAQGYKTIWSGYITPDSFTEDLSYRGTISLTARDNVGHLQDFTFDMQGDSDGMVYVYQLLEAGWEKIQCPIPLYLFGDEQEANYLQTNGVDAEGTLLNVAQFEGKNWYEVFEEVLYAYGWVLRYWGDNIFRVCSLRDLPKQNRVSVDDLPHKTPVFVTGATRELVPAVSKIDETIKYELSREIILPRLVEEDFTGEVLEYTCAVEGYTSDLLKYERPEHPARVYPIVDDSPSGWRNIQSSTLFFNPADYVLSPMTPENVGDEVFNGLFIASNSIYPRQVWFEKQVNCIDTVISVQLGCVIDYSPYEGWIYINERVGLEEIRYAIQLEYNGKQYFYDSYKRWREDYAEGVELFSPATKTKSFSTFVTMPQGVESAILRFFIIKIGYKALDTLFNAKGLYTNILSVSFDTPDSVPLMDTNRIITNYAWQNSVIIDRSPKIGPAMNSVILPSVIKNGIFYRQDGVIHPATEWNWRGGEPTQMGVLIHQQLLCYYAKPNNLITGTIVNADLNNMRAIYMWGDKEHILISGTYNLLNGHIEGAVLREFLRYEDMWGNARAYDLRSVDTSAKAQSSVTYTGGGKTYKKATEIIAK